MSQIHPGDALALGADGLVYPGVDMKPSRIFGFATSRDTENLDEVWVRMLGAPGESLYRLAPGYWCAPEPPQGAPVQDETLMDAVEWYLEHR